MTSWLLPLFSLVAVAAAPGSNWPAFRGEGTSLSASTGLPTEWGEGKNIAWQVELPGYGQASPVTWGGKLFVTSVVGDSKEELAATCLDLASGKEIWTTKLVATNKAAVSDYNSRGAPTPLVDADRLYAFFESGDLIALDHDGKELWRRRLTQDFGEFKGNHGIGSSLAGAGDTLLVLIDHEGPSYLLAIDKASGKDRWKIDRPSKVSWSSPVVSEDGLEVIVSSAGTVEGFSIKDGRRLWWFEGLEGNTVPSATVGKQFVIVGSSEKSSNVALRRGGSGQLTAEQVAWRSTDASASFSSPLSYEGRVYFVNRSGVGFCLDEATGKTLWSERLAGSCWASPLGAEGRVYFFHKDGATTVVKADATYQQLAVNKLTLEGRVYGVAAARGALVLRTGQKLICVGRP